MSLIIRHKEGDEDEHYHSTKDHIEASGLTLRLALGRLYQKVYGEWK
jgi:hypothetical protein